MNRRNFIRSGIALSTVAGGCMGIASRVQGADLCAEERLSDDDPGLVRLRSAENPYGPPQSALEAAQAELARGHRYPRSKILAFRELIAAENGLTAEQVAIGAGSIELMINTGLAYGKPGRAVLSVEPTWNTTMLYAKQCGAEWIRVPLGKKYRSDFDRMRDAIKDNVDLVYICNPNNPSGVAEDDGQLETFVKETARTRVVMVDEAFIDCLDEAEQRSMKRLLPKHENIVVSRTFSKLWGMAGFRIGYMMGDARVLAKLKSTIPTLQMQNRIGVAAAMAAFVDRPFIEFSRQKMKESANIAYEILDRHGLHYIPSDANFISFQVNQDGKAFIAKLAEHKVTLKTVSLEDGKQWARVSCGSPNELDAFDQALGKVLA